MPQSKVKICGVRDQDTLDATINAGADFVGFVFYPPSPRAISVEGATTLAENAEGRIQRVGLFVNPDDNLLDSICTHLDIIQLHGSETPARCQEIKARTGKKIMKALAIKTKNDLAQISAYEPICDWLLFDAKPTDTPNALPGGNGLSFDWSILQGQNFSKPWMLAGGLTPKNVQEAITLLKPDAVDVSSGVESTTAGQKSIAKINTFITAAKS